MFGNCMVEMAARAAGFTPAQLAVIERDFPATARLLNLIIKAQPLIQKLAPIVEKMAPLFDQASPLVKEAMPIVEEAVPLFDQISKEVSAIAPAIQIVMAVVQRDMAQGASVQDSFRNVAQRIEGAFRGGSQTW